MKKIFNFPLYKDWLFYYSIINLINLLSSLLELSRNPLVTEYTVSISQILLSYLLFWGVPLYIRFRLKLRNATKNVINSKEKIIFVSFSTDDRLIVNEVIAELKKKTSLNIWMQEHIHGGHDGPEVIKDTIEKSVGALVFFSNNSFHSEFINDTEIPLIKQKQLEDNEYFVIPLRVSRTEPEFIEEFSELQTIPSKSQTITRSNSIEFAEIINKISDSIPGHAKFTDIKEKRRDISKILTFFGWILAIASLIGTVFPQSLLNNYFQVFADGSETEYTKYQITSDPESDICTLWLQDGRRQLQYMESSYDSIGEAETLEEQINLREDLLDVYKVFLFDMQRVVDYHASQSYEYIEISQAISTYIKITLEQLSAENFYAGDSIENRDKAMKLYETQVENEVVVSSFCFDNGFEVAPTSLLGPEERLNLFENLLEMDS